YWRRPWCCSPWSAVSSAPAGRRCGRGSPRARPGPTSGRPGPRRESPTRTHRGRRGSAGRRSATCTNPSSAGPRGGAPAPGTGYRARAWEKLKEALKLDTPKRNVEELRQEAVACMGDFTGLEPTTLKGFKAAVSAVAAHPQGTGLAVGLADGTVLLKSLPTGA